jgi:hypothetical protein
MPSLTLCRSIRRCELPFCIPLHGIDELTERDDFVVLCLSLAETKTGNSRSSSVSCASFRERGRHKSGKHTKRTIWLEEKGTSDTR